MKRPFTADPGSNLQSIALDNATPIKGVIIDNPSGGWLYIVEVKDFCPPYTMQWGRDLEYSGSALTVNYGVSPANQVSTRQGDPYTVTLYDTPVGYAAGTPSQFIQQFNPLNTLGLIKAITTGDAPVTTSVTTNLVTGTNKRIRMHGLYLNLIGALVPLFTPIIAEAVAVNMPRTRLHIGGMRTHDEMTWLPYVDIITGFEVTLFMLNYTAAALDPSFSAGAANQNIAFDMVYEII